jgi:hypothetical protein
MNVGNFFIVLFKVGVSLLVAGKLAEVTFDYAVRMARVSRFSFISKFHFQMAKDLWRHQKA